MSVIVSDFPILITLTVFCLLLPHLSGAEKTPLAIQVCKNTTDFDFCRQSIYSDPRANDADRVVLANIAFGNAYLNATDTKGYIASLIKSAGDGDVARGLRNCLGKYDEALRAILEVLRDLNDETFYEFDKLSLDVEKNSRACERGFGGRSPLTARNMIMIKIVDICFVVSKLFQYSGVSVDESVVVFGI